MRDLLRFPVTPVNYHCRPRIIVWIAVCKLTEDGRASQRSLCSKEYGPYHRHIKPRARNENQVKLLNQRLNLPEVSLAADMQASIRPNILKMAMPQST